MTTLPSITRGDPVTVSWQGRTRYGVATGDPYADSLPTGAAFLPVHFDDDGSEANVDTRVVMFGCHAPDGCVGFADCPCARCRHTRRTVTASHPDHSHPSDRSYCGACA